MADGQLNKIMDYIDTNLPDVSIIISSYNRLSDLKETIKFTLEISYKNIEIIVVDGDSNDGSKEFLENLDNKKINTYFVPNYGSAYTHNIGMENARGKYIFLIDDDCFLHKDVVSESVEIFENNSNLSAIGFGLINPKIINFNEIYNKPLKKINKLDIDTSYEVVLFTCAAAFRKKSLQKVNYMEYLMRWSSRGEDKEMLINLIKNKYNTINIPELIAFHKVSPSNRPSSELATNGINSLIFILFKHFPIFYIFKYMIMIIFNSLFYVVFKNENSYLKGIIKGLKNSHKLLNNKESLTFKVSSEIKLQIPTYFNISSDNKWPGS